jgi:hypothetical protein
MINAKKKFTPRPAITVEGHGFSRAAQRSLITRALAPEEQSTFGIFLSQLWVRK